VGKSVKIVVQFFGPHPQGEGSLVEEMEVPAGLPVKGVIDLFGQKYGGAIAGTAGTFAAKDIEGTYMVMLNGRSLEKDKQFTSKVQNGDRITIFSPVCGG